MEEEQILWQLTDVSKKGYKKTRLNQVSCNLRSGITAITGLSGAGKTTLLNLLSRQEMADSGSLVCKIPQADCPFYIVPQDFGLWPHLNVIDHLLKVMPQESKATAEELLNDFDLNDKALEYAEFLSQGEKSRLSLARALATGSQVLIMDEPLANVDSARKDKYWTALLNHLNKRQGSLIFSTHTAKEVLAYADSVICMDNGEILIHADVDKVYHQPACEKTSRLLGPGNWLSEGPFAAENGFYRPEKVSLQEDSSSEFTIEATRFYGAYHKSTLQSENQRTTIFHCHTDKVQAGMKVILTILFILLVSCTKSEDSLIFKEITTWNIPASGHKLPGPRAITCGNNHEIIVLDDAGRLLVYDKSGKLKRQWSMPDTSLGHPEGVTVFKDGKIAVADTHFARVVVFNADGSEAFRFGSRGDKDGQFYSPVGITLDADENIYVCEYGFNDRVQKFTKEGKFLLSFGKSGIEFGNMQRASDMVWKDGLLYVADAVNNRVQIFSDDGKFLRLLKNDGEEIPFYLPYDVDLGPEQNLWIIEYANCRLMKTDLNGKILGTFGRAGTELNCFNNPWGLGVDQEGTVYVADTANRRIVVLRQ